MSDPDSRGIQFVPVDRLLLDNTNPRLPESLHEATEPQLLKFFRDREALEEIAQSYLDNGFFEHEPLIVVPAERDGRYVVVEGNRRLAALKTLHQSSEVDALNVVLPEDHSEKLKLLREIPCFFITDRNKVHAYIGFRHIGALKTWPPEAKARYLLAEATRLANDRVQNPFRELGRRVGSNAQGVRTSYLAIRLLLYAREEFGLKVSNVQESRFGVWLRCMNSGDIRQYIGLGQATTYQEIEEALSRVDQNRLAEVLGDLRIESDRRAVLGDSRDVTTYGRVLMNERAHATLRQSENLSLAKQIVEESELNIRVRKITQSVQIFVDALHRAEDVEMSSDLLSATDDLFAIARSAHLIVKGRTGGRNNES